MRRFLLQPWDLLFYILNQSHIYSRIMWNENVVINMSGSVRKKAVSRQALAKQDSIRAEPKRAQWSKQEYTTEEIIKQCSLPQIVKCSGGAISPQLDKPLPINFSEPIMLYDTRTVRNLLARNISFSTTSQRYSETNETIVIPADYEGIYVF